MKRCVIFLGVGCLLGCGGIAPDLPPSLLGSQPLVIGITPTAQSVVPQVGEIQVRFSHPIDPLSLHRDSFAVVVGVEPTAAPEKVVSGWQEHALESVKGSYAVTEEGMEGRFTPYSPLAGKRHYAVVITPAVHTPAGVPLSQAPGASATPFVSFFATSPQGGIVADPSAVASASSATDGESSSPSGVAPSSPTADSHPASAPDRIVPTELMLNEIFYDVPGVDTNGVLFVELRGTPAADVGGYKIHFVNGDTGVVTESLTLPDGSALGANGVLVIADGMTGNLQTTQVQNADLVDNFDPQNGPDAVQLVDPKGQLVDVVGYGTPLPVYGENGLPMYEGTPGPDAPAAQSITRKPGTPDTNNNANDFVVGTPTPGVE